MRSGGALSVLGAGTGLIEHASVEHDGALVIPRVPLGVGRRDQRRQVARVLLEHALIEPPRRRVVVVAARDVGEPGERFGVAGLLAQDALIELLGSREVSAAERLVRLDQALAEVALELGARGVRSRRSVERGQLRNVDGGDGEDRRVGARVGGALEAPDEALELVEERMLVLITLEGGGSAARLPARGPLGRARRSARLGRARAP